MLGSMEDKVHQSKSQGTTHRLDNSLVALSNKYSPPGKIMFSLVESEFSWLKLNLIIKDLQLSVALFPFFNPTHLLRFTLTTKLNVLAL